MSATPCRPLAPAGRGFASLVFALAAAAPSRPAAPADLDTVPAFAIHVRNAVTVGTLQRLLDGARRRLADPRCQAVLDDFADGDGRPLRARLAQTGQRPDAYLGWLVFYDGATHPRCADGRALAVTTVGGRAVFVCPIALATQARLNAGFAEATLIHEALHTLGLGENPPTSRQITDQVMRRCRH